MLIYKYIIIFISIFTLLISCAAGAKHPSAVGSLEQLKERLADRSYTIEASWAYPLMTQGISQVANTGLIQPGSTPNSINLMGNTNFFRVMRDSIFISLPYYGERQMGGSYGSRDVGITFEGIPESYRIQDTDQKDRVIVGITTRDDIETIAFTLILFPSKKAEIVVNSSHRTTIRYSGNLNFSDQ